MTEEKSNEENSVKVGLYNKNFKMASKEMLEERAENIRGRNSNFSISAGPLIWEGKQLKDTYVLEINYRDSEEAHRSSLWLGGWGQCLFHDYGKKANELARKFCDENGLMINNHLNSWPEYQAIVSKRKKN